MRARRRRALAGADRARTEPGGSALAAALLEQLPEGVVACDAGGRLVAYNRRARELHGVPADAVRAQEYAPYHRRGGGAVSARETPLFSALGGHAVRDAALERRRAGVAGRMLLVTAEPLLDGAGRIAGAAETVRDDGEHFAREQRLRRKGAIAAQMGAGVVVIRVADGRIVEANAAFERLFGYGPGALLGRHVSAVNAVGAMTPEERAEDIMGALRRDGVWQGDIQNVRSDGTAFWTSANVSAFDDPEHGVVWIAVQEDVTERRRAEDSVRAAEERFRLAFEDAPIGMALLGVDLRLIDVNAALCAITGHARDALIGRGLAEITHPEDIGLDAELARQVFGGEILRYRVTKRWIAADGTAVPVRLAVSVVRGAGNEPLYGLVLVDRADRQSLLSPEVTFP
jgi:PAS domain S-box-containing protein